MLAQKKVSTLAAVLVLSLVGCAAGADATEVASADLSGDPPGTEVVRLATKDKREEILIGYTPDTKTVDGDSVTTMARDITIVTTNMFNFAVRAVLLDECSEFGHHLFEIVAECDMHDLGGGRWEIKTSESQCRLTVKPDNVDTTFPSWLVSRRSREGHDIRCSQEIAVVGDGRFLTDPVNESHNFKFQMK
jgi:hypothetical protein